MRLFVFLLLFPILANAVDIGINIKNFNNIDTVTKLLNYRNLKQIRINLDANSSSTSAVEAAVKMRDNNINVQGILLTNLQYDSSCSQNFTAIRQKYYDETYAIVNKFKYAIYDYELLNESTLRPWLLAQVAANTGELASNYTGKTCYATLAAGLDGMADAIDDIRTASGLPLRIILGTTGRDWGFIQFMLDQGVKVDVIGYHVYPANPQALLSVDTWYGYTTNVLYTRLAVYNKPVTINEFNCGDIFGTYDNVANSANTTTCINALKKHLPDVMNQTTANIESILAYELHDEPEKSSPENKFGMTYTIYNEKLQMAALSVLSGGKITSSEKTRLISGGFFTCQEIVNFKEKAFYAPLIVTVPNVTTCN